MKAKLTKNLKIINLAFFLLRRYSTAGADAGVSAGASAISSTSGAVAALPAGAGVTCSTTSAGAAITSRSVRYISPLAQVLRILSELARQCRRSAQGWHWLDVLRLLRWRCAHVPPIAPSCEERDVTPNANAMEAF